VTRLLRQPGQPFADSSLFAVDAVSELMRRHVSVALSGDGGELRVMSHSVDVIGLCPER